MEILKELNQLERDILRQRFLEHLREGGEERKKLFNSHIDNPLSKPHCFKVNIFAKDYGKIWIYADLEGRPFHTLSMSVKYIKENQAFLKETRTNRLNGKKVKTYMDLKCM